jgi:hypothetical protein
LPDTAFTTIANIIFVISLGSVPALRTIICADTVDALVGHLWSARGHSLLGRFI